MSSSTHRTQSGRDRIESSGTSATDLLTTKELADYLRLNERTVLKLAALGELPGVRLGNQWRFRRAVIDTWIDDQMLGVRQRSSTHNPSAPSTFELRDGFREQHIITELQGQSKTQVLEELCARAGELDLVRDRTWFLGALLERENVLSSAVGEGIAFPHTLHRHPEQITTPFVLLGRSTGGVDFSAPDGGPVHVVVLLGLRFQELHLPWLSRLSKLLRHRTTRSEIMAAVGSEEIHRLLTERVDAATKREH